MEKLVLKFKDGKHLTIKVWESASGYLGNVIDTVGDSVAIGEVIDIATDFDVDGVLRSLGYPLDHGYIDHGQWVWNNT